MDVSQMRDRCVGVKRKTLSGQNAEATQQTQPRPVQDRGTWVSDCLAKFPHPPGSGFSKGPAASSTCDGLLGPHNDVHYWADLCFLPGKGQELACDQSPDCLLDQVPPTTQSPLKGICDDLIKSDRYLKNH